MPMMMMMRCTLYSAHPVVVVCVSYALWPSRRFCCSHPVIVLSPCEDAATGRVGE